MRKNDASYSGTGGIGISRDEPCGLRRRVFAGLRAAPPAEAGRASGPLAAGATEERDVEAPEVFQASESGLWNGRPSLGGVWVAHPDCDPTSGARHHSSTSANGQSVIRGALPPRAREPGPPRIQVSSDAAAELGLLVPDSPRRSRSAALRRESRRGCPRRGPLTEAEPIETAALDEPLAAAAAAIDEAEEGTEPVIGAGRQRARCPGRSPVQPREALYSRSASSRSRPTPTQPAPACAAPA